jgi:hypothetical protein
VPDNRKIVFVLESPPKSGLYFYNPEGRLSEPLFSAMMKDILEIKPESKDAGLREFARHGCSLVGATYTPVNHDELSLRERNRRILRDLPVLVGELREYVDPRTRVVLVKANICELLESALISEGFPVVNRGVRIPFPSNGQQGKFRENSTPSTRIVLMQKESRSGLVRAKRCLVRRGISLVVSLQVVV